MVANTVPALGQVSHPAVPTAALEEMSAAELVTRAACRERDAVGELLVRRMPMLATMAKRIASWRLDPDDLLADAISRLLEQWADGGVPHDNIDANLIRSMRKRVVDEVRSPRSRTSSLGSVPEPVEEPVCFHLKSSCTGVRPCPRGPGPSVDRSAPGAQATIVDGRKPGDLVAESAALTARSTPLQHRTKAGRSRALPQTLLEQRDQPACRRCAHELPRTVTAVLVDDPSDAAAGSRRVDGRGFGDRCGRHRALRQRSFA